MSEKEGIRQAWGHAYTVLTTKQIKGEKHKRLFYLEGKNFKLLEVKFLETNLA